MEGQLGIRSILVFLILIICTYTDIKRRQISGVCLIIFGIAGMICFILGRELSFYEVMAGVFVGFGILSLTALTRGAIGAGDGWLLCVTGILLGGFCNIKLLSGGVFLAAVYGIFHFFRNQRNVKGEFPFVPFLLGSYLLMQVL